MKTPLFATFLLGLCGGWIASCSDDSPRECTPRETRLCACTDRNREGVEACLSDGSGYGECNCSGTPRPDGTGGTSGEGGVPTPLIGRACTENAQCGAGLTCFVSTANNFLGGGAGNGYCTLECNADAECTGIDQQSQCVVSVPGASGLCLRTCFSQDPASLAENKCLGRRDVACQSEAYLKLAMFSGSRQDGWCYPQCGSNEDCPGRQCDLARGLCVDTVTSGLPIGASCTQNADCAGRLCIGIGTPSPFCSAPCVFGQRLGCGDGLSGPRTAGCLAAQQQGFLVSEGSGDVGYCVELCGAPSDCLQAASGWECALSQNVAQVFSAPGVCRPPTPLDGGVDSGADGGDTPSGGDVDASLGDAG
jgi:hypothetical protein